MTKDLSNLVPPSKEESQDSRKFISENKIVKIITYIPKKIGERLYELKMEFYRISGW